MPGRKRWLASVVRSADGPFSPAGITLLYIVLGAIWIVLGDTLLVLAPTRYQLPMAVGKGILYVLLTGTLLFFLVQAGRRALQRRAAELQASDARMKALFRAAPTGIGVMLDRVFVEVNERFCQMVGYRPEELLGQSARMIYPTQEEFEFVGREKYRQIEESGTGTVEARWLRKDGRVIDVLLSSTSVDHADHAAGVVFTALDITERVETARALAEHREHLEVLVDQRTQELRATQEALLRQERLAALGQLTGSVSHELRNPLGVVRASLFILARRFRGQEPEIDEVIERAERGVARCSALVTDLLDFSRGSCLNQVPTDLDAFVAACAREYAFPETIAVALELHCQAVVPLDRERFRRCLINLLSNACDAIGSAGGVVRVETQTEPGTVVLRVADSGCGISPEQAERVFEPLFSTKSFGVGLGLPIVRQIVELHGGSVALDGSTGEGTTAVVRLPLSGR